MKDSFNQQLPLQTDHESFAVVTQPGLGYIELLFSPPDHEDNTYIAPFWFARDVPGLSLPDPQRKEDLFKPVQPD